MTKREAGGSIALGAALGVLLFLILLGAQSVIGAPATACFNRGGDFYLWPVGCYKRMEVKP